MAWIKLAVKKDYAPLAKAKFFSDALFVPLGEDENDMVQISVYF